MRAYLGWLACLGELDADDRVVELVDEAEDRVVRLAPRERLEVRLAEDVLLGHDVGPVPVQEVHGVLLRLCSFRLCRRHVAFR